MKTATASKTYLIAEELDHIADANGGVLQPEKVVAFAQNPDTALHDQFEWSDSEAARKYRLDQAREVIRLRVTIIPHKEETIRAYVSLTTDRGVPGGGYRKTLDVISDEQRFKQMLADARGELQSFRRKYAILQELAPVFTAMEEVFTA